MNTSQLVTKVAAVGAVAAGAMVLMALQAPNVHGDETGPPTTSICQAASGGGTFTYAQTIQRLLANSGVTTSGTDRRIDVEVNTLLDKEAKTILLAIYDSATSEDHQILFNYEDSTCGLAPELKPVVEHVLAEDRVVQAEQCVSMRDFIASGATVDERGRTLNRTAADQYLSQWC